MGSNNCFSKITANVFSPWHCVNTYMKTLDQQTTQSSTFIDVLRLDKGQ